MKEKFYITTAIPYTSRVPHIGNTYEAILTDAIARFKRETGYDVFFLTGTDEHGQKIQQVADEEGVTAQEHVDRVSGEIRRIWDMLNVSYDGWLRTTDPDHCDRVGRAFEKLFRQGDIYKKDYEAPYCTACESFYTDTQLVDGCCPDCGAKVTMAREETYFFRLSAYGKKLEEYIENNPDFIQPESRRNEMLNNFIRPGLQDICISRSTFDWGVHVPFDPKHVVYVWIDALMNYITALGYDPEGDHGELFKKYWPCNVHIIGKDILRFHTIYWPAWLMALGVELPKQVFGHPWILRGEDKMSKSKGNVIYAADLVRHFGCDAVRYYCLHEIPFGQDGTITYELMINRFNADLANILGNLVSRTVAMAHKYFGGVVPAPGPAEGPDEELLAVASACAGKVKACMDSLHVADALDEIWTLLRRSNKYIDETEPWALAKDETKRDRLAAVIYNLLECVRIAGVLLAAFLPETSEKILRVLNTEAKAFESAEAFGGLAAGTQLGTTEPLFARIDEEKKLAEIMEEIAASAEPTKEYEPVAPEITIDDFGKIDLRCGKVTACEPVPKSDKLLKLMVDLGFETRQVVSGIAKWYKPEELIGRRVTVVANLKPVKLRGVDSFGMILAGEDESGNVSILSPDEGIDLGGRIH